MAHVSSSLLSPSLSVSLLLLLLSTVAVSASLLRGRGCLPTLGSCPPVLLNQLPDTEGEICDSERRFLALALAGSCSCFLVQRPQSHLVEDSNEMQQKKKTFLGVGGGVTLRQSSLKPCTSYINSTRGEPESEAVNDAPDGTDPLFM